MGRQQVVFGELLEQRKQQQFQRQQQFERQRRRRWQFWWRRRVGKLVGNDMHIGRIAKHLLHHHWWARHYFPPTVLAAIERATKAGEATHSGQVQFVVEGALHGA